MARSGAPSNRRPDTNHLFRFSGAELIDGTNLTDSVFWDKRLGGVLLLDGSGSFYPAAQVKRCWWDSTDDDHEGDAE